MTLRPIALSVFSLAAAMASAALAQFPGGPPPGGGFGGGGPFGGPPGMQERKILKDFDLDGNKRLDAKERAAAREALAKGPQPRRFGPRGGGENQTPPVPGPKLTPKQVKTYKNEALYDAAVLRTLFLEFENPEWEKELADFNNTDVEVPAKATVDGKTFAEVGVHFRGASSFMMVGEGRKRSLNVSFDEFNKEQRLLGYRTLNLLNSHMDPTMLRAVLYLQIAREYLPAYQANFMRVVINGESWGVYPNVEQFNADFVKKWYGSAKGARWKVPGSPMGRGGLAYLGEDPAAYKRLYEIKSKDDPKDWAAFIRLTKVLTQTPVEKLEAELAPVFDIEGALRFLALEKTLINSDGYWTRASDYNIVLDDKGKFHVFPHDANEALAPPEGPPGGFRRFMGGPGGPRPEGGGGFGPPPGFPAQPGGGPGGPGGLRPEGGGGFGPPPGFPAQPGGGPGGGGPGFPRPPMGPRDAKLDLFVGADDPDKVLISRLLQVPSLRTRYLALCREIAGKWLDWTRLEPLARKYQALIAEDVKTDTRKLDTTENFFKAIDQETEGRGFGPFGGGKHMSLKQFAEERRAFVLAYRDPGQAAAAAKQQP